jgi:DNA repair exonuclease SbcCD ATPase subunit
MVEGINKTDKLVFDLNMYQVDYNEQKIKSLKKEIAEKYGVPLRNVEVNFNPITVKDDGTKISLASDIVNNIQDPKFQQKLFSEYIELKEISDVNIDDIIEIDNTVNAHINFDSYAKYKSYKIKYAKWDNYLSYGKGNFFDFTKLKGIVLLCGEPENQCGKTTFAIDLIRFALFGKSPKCPTLESTFNIYLENETEVMVEVGIEIEGVDYVIRRTVTRPLLKKRTKKSKCKQKVEYFKLLNGDYELIENCEGESGTQTNNIIRESIGNVEDFNLVISATRKTLDNLLDMGQTDKGKLFSRWLGLLSIEEKEKIAKDEYKKLSKDLLSNKYNKATLESEIRDMNTVIASNNKEVVSLEEKLNTSNDRINQLNIEKNDIQINRKEIKQELIRIDVTTVENNILSFQNENMVKQNEYSIAKKEYDTVKDSVFVENDYKMALQNKMTYENANAELKGQIKIIKNNNAHIEALIAQKICPTCHQAINVEEQNSLIGNNNEEIKKLIAQGVENKKKIDELVSIINDMEIQRVNVQRKSNLEFKMSAINAQMKNIDLQIENFKKQKEEIETNKENIRYNNEIDNKIRICDESIRVENNIKEQLIRNIQAYKSENKSYEEEIKNHQLVIDRLIEEEKIIHNWNIYQELVGKNGIVKIVLKNALPIINNEMKRLLEGLCDFDVVMSVNENNSINLDLLRGGKEIDLGTGASGFESTIASLALRAALGNIAILPSSNFLVLDEILSGISAENMSNIMTLYNRMLNNYEFILHICHDTTLVDYHNQIITVSKKDNVSVIEVK